MNPNIYEYDENCQTGRRLAVFVFAGPKFRFFILYEVFLLAVRFQIYDEETDLEAGDCMFINRTALHRIMGKEDSHYHSYIISIQLAKVWLELILHLPETSENIPTQNHERIRTLISFIHQNYDRDISLKDIEGAASVSQTECQRCIF